MLSPCYFLCCFNLAHSCGQQDSSLLRRFCIYIAAGFPCFRVIAEPGLIHHSCVCAHRTCKSKMALCAIPDRAILQTQRIHRDRYFAAHAQGPTLARSTEIYAQTINATTAQYSAHGIFNTFSRCCR